MLRSALTLTLALPLLALSAPATAAAPASVPTCQGRPATVIGTPGDDRLRGTAGPDVIVGRGGDDRIRALAGDDLVCGGRGADDLLGGPGADELRGGAGAVDGSTYTGDVVDGGVGADVLAPGVGPVPQRVRGVQRADTVSYRHSRRAVEVDLEAGTARGQGADTIVGRGRLAVLGSRYDDVLRGSAGPDSLDGGRGDDQVSGGGGRDWLVADEGADQVDGGRGSDFILASKGDDLLDGGPGADWIVAASWSPSTVIGGPGNDYVSRWLTAGEVGTVDGGPGRNQLEIDVQIWPGESNVRADLDRGSQTATIRAGERTQTMAFADFDAFTLWGGDWTFTGTEEDDFVQVLQGRLEAHGLGGDDWLMGDRRNDLLDGGDGTDTAWGGAGRNTCIDVEKGDCNGMLSHRTRVAAGDRTRRELLVRWWATAR
ncbi:MAG: calcium-binding protein [Nocardioides sp.]